MADQDFEMSPQDLHGTIVAGLSHKVTDAMLNLPNGTLKGAAQRLAGAISPRQLKKMSLGELRGAVEKAISAHQEFRTKTIQAETYLAGAQTRMEVQRKKEKALAEAEYQRAKAALGMP